MQIAPFEPRDFEDASELLALCVGRTARRELEEYLQNPAVSVICAKDGGLRAILIIMICADCCDILDIAVADDYRRRGAAGAILEYGTSLCRERGVTHQMLEVRTANTQALSFYKKAGFERISLRANYYSDPVGDGAVLRREI